MESRVTKFDHVVVSVFWRGRRRIHDIGSCSNIRPAFKTNAAVLIVMTEEIHSISNSLCKFTLSHKIPKGLMVICCFYWPNSMYAASLPL